MPYGRANFRLGGPRKAFRRDGLMRSQPRNIGEDRILDRGNSMSKGPEVKEELNVGRKWWESSVVTTRWRNQMCPM